MKAEMGGGRLATWLAALLLALAALVSAAKEPYIAPSYAWTMLQPLGVRQPAPMDTSLYNYFQRSVPSDASLAYATTGNLGAEGMDMIYWDREPAGDFFLQDGLRHYLPLRQRFYNTRIPMTLVSYNLGGGKEDSQDRLSMVFSGNMSPKFQIGANADYIYSKGSYDCQAVKNLTWGLSSSYIGERWEMQAYYNHWNSVNKENGGITDDLYVTDPAELQGGVTKVDCKTIPVRLSAAHTRLVGGAGVLNLRYKVGFHRDLPMAEGDTMARKEFIPTTAFTADIAVDHGRHTFRNTNTAQAKEFWQNTYLDDDGTADHTSYTSVSGTLGVSLLEGFNKWAKAGLSLFATYRHVNYAQTADTVATTGPLRPEGLSPWPLDGGARVAPKATENLIYAGAQLTKQQGRIINYEATARLGLTGRTSGDVHLDGTLWTHIPMLGDTVSVAAYARFSNEAAPYLLENYVSNHFMWRRGLGKTRRLRLGGNFYVPQTGTRLDAGVENVQNLVYFGPDCLPAQAGGSVQVFSARAAQDLAVGILHWNNKLCYQTSTDQDVLPLPKLAVYSNLYILFKVAGVLTVQLGVDCDYYTRYRAPGYQPATASFYNQREALCGNFAFMNAYVNCHLSRTRFYVMYTHVNASMGGKNYFSIPHYPLNPGRLQMGLSVDFRN